MRIKAVFLLGCLGLGAFTSLADYSISIRPQFYCMIANQLDHVDEQGTVNNRMSAVLPNPPENTTLYPDRGPFGGYLSYNYSVDNPGWSGDGLLAPGTPFVIKVDPSAAPD